MLIRRHAAPLLVLLAVGCGDDGSAPAEPDAGTPFAPFSGPDDYCPGQPHCTGEGDGQLHVGAARRSITPDLASAETEWSDADGNFRRDSDEDFVDDNDNGKFDAFWLVNANGRPAARVNDPLEARAIALRWNDVTVAIVYLDTYLYFIEEIDRIKQDPAVQALAVDHVIVGSTHNHSAIDTVGMNGPIALEPGVSLDYLDLVRTRAAEAIVEAVESLEPARMFAASIQTIDPDTGSTLDYVSDTREPYIFDPTLTVLRFGRQDAPQETIATIVNWASHPEYSWIDHNDVTADYPHWLREVVENGLPDDGIAGVGGTTVFVQGALGGQIGPGRVAPIGPDGTPIAEDGLAKAQAAGENVGRLALDALVDAEEVSAPALSYRTAEIFAEMENAGLTLLYIVGVIDRELFNYDADAPINDTNVPWIRSRVTYLQIGNAAFVTAPGELHPELWVGGYDGTWSWGQEILSGALANAPDLSQAPAAPYLRDLVLANPGVEYPMVAGLAEDGIGYIIPAFNYVLSDSNPYIDQAEGHHYEEVYSTSPRVEEQIQHPMMELARWRPPTE